MKRALIVALALVCVPAFADKDAERTFRKWAVEKMEILRKERDPVERAAAAAYLGSFKDLDVITALSVALSDPDARVRAAAASSLWSAGNAAEPARANLTKALDDPAPTVVAQAAGALQALGMKEAELVPARKRVFEAPGVDYYSRFLAARGLVGNAPPLALLDAMLEYLRRSSESENREIAGQALEKLAKSGERSLQAPLAREVRKPGKGQIVLLKTLAVFDPKPLGWVELQVELLDSAESSVRFAALGYLRKETDERDIKYWAPHAARMLRDPDESVRINALWAFGGAKALAAQYIDAVVGATRDPEARVRSVAADTIGEMGDTKQPATAAAKALVAERGRPVLASLMQDDPNEEVRSYAKRAFEKLAPAGPSTAAASPAPAGKAPDAGAEARAVAFLREREITFEDGSYYVALTKNDLPVIRAFLDAGMSATASVADNGPPLVIAMLWGSGCSPKVRPTSADTKAVVKLLVERGANAGVADKNGNTALMGAAQKGCDREVMKLLLAAGAKVNAINASKVDAFDFGLIYPHDGLEELIAAGYRIPPARAKELAQYNAAKPVALALIKKATGK